MIHHLILSVYQPNEMTLLLHFPEEEYEEKGG